jgi:opacity protein-like surface antigen
LAAFQAFAKHLFASASVTLSWERTFSLGGTYTVIDQNQRNLPSSARTQTVLDVLGSAKVGDWYGMVTGRLGYAWDRWLLYVKGGAAFVRASRASTGWQTAKVMLHLREPSH